MRLPLVSKSRLAISSWPSQVLLRHPIFEAALGKGLS